MLYKEWLVTRWKIGLIAAGFAILLVLRFNFGGFGSPFEFQNWLLYCILLTIVAGIIAGADVICEEAEKGTLSFLLTKPLSRADIYLAKVLPNASGLALIIVSVNMLVLVIDRAQNRYIDVAGATTATLAIAALGVATVGLSALFSALLRNTIQSLSVSVMIALLLLFAPIFSFPTRWIWRALYVEYRDYDISGFGMGATNIYDFPRYYPMWGANLLMAGLLLVVAGVFLVTGLAVFRRRSF